MRAAIEQANVVAGPDSIALATGLSLLQLDRSELTVVDELTISGPAYVGWDLPARWFPPCEICCGPVAQYLVVLQEIVDCGFGGTDVQAELDAVRVAFLFTSYPAELAAIPCGQGAGDSRKRRSGDAPGRGAVEARRALEYLSIRYNMIRDSELCRRRHRGHLQRP